MRRTLTLTLAVASAVALSACQKAADSEVNRAMQAVNAIDDNNLSEIMLTVADPNEAVTYFRRASAEQPTRIDLKRGLAISLVRARKNVEGARAWSEVVAMEGSNHADEVELADALIRAGRWDTAEATLDSVPPTYETFKRYRLEAMIADGNKEWSRADSFYETAIGLTTQPANVMNNWGYSKLTRGDYPGAERLFTEAIQYDRDLFTAKNNLALARAAQRKYELPLVEMSQIERAQMMHTVALAAVKQGDVTIGKGLLQEAIDTHPQHFEEAVRALRALDVKVTN
ncbi:MAG: tetratricopeptide repeat protein [Pseudomonadota bacterium]